MRSISRLVLLVLAVVLPLGCNHHDDATTSVFGDGNTNGGGNPVVLASFQPDAPTPQPGSVRLTGVGSGRRNVTLSVEEWASRLPSTFTARLRVDPALRVVSTAIGLRWSCSTAEGFTVSATATPGEWAIHRGRTMDYWSCLGCEIGNQDTDQDGMVGRILLEASGPGSFRIELLPEGTTPVVCDCVDCLSPQLFGGSVVVAQ